MNALIRSVTHVLSQLNTQYITRTVNTNRALSFVVVREGNFTNITLTWHGYHEVIQSRIHEIGFKNDRVVLKFERHSGIAAETASKFQNGRKTLNL